MAIPSIFSPVQPQDFTLKPIQVHKKFILVRNSDFYTGSVPITGSGYKLWEARYLGEKMKLGSSTYPTNSFDGTYQNIIWSSIDAQYYRFPYDRFSTFEHSNGRFTYKFLNYSASIIAVPQGDFGEMIKPGSVEITGSGFNLTDDQNGNLYDVSIDTGSFPSTKNLVAYWGFNDIFRKAKKVNSTDYQLSSDRIQYTSKTFQPDRESLVKNVNFRPRTDMSGGLDHGLTAVFNSSSILTDNQPDINFTQEQDFTIAFWTHFNSSENTGSLISKRGTIFKQTFGYQKKSNLNDLIVSTEFTSASYIDESTNVYPYDFQLSNSSSLVFRRSDGINTQQLNISMNNNSWNHIAVVKTGSSYRAYKNGTLATLSSNNRLGHCVNEHSLIFGAFNQSLLNPFTGSIDEVRFYNKGLTPDEIATLASTSSQGFYQTAVVGNVFYRNGMIVLGGLNTDYSRLINSDFTLKFRSTHTIYQYETLIRIKKDSFNLSQNPTARQNPYTDLILNDMTASLDQGGLFPYATSIGLYNDSGELMAVAKLNQPLQMRDDTDINILIRWDS